MNDDTRGLSFDISSLHAAYGAGRTPQDVVSEVYRRIEAVGDPHIFLHLREMDAVVNDAAALPAFDPEAAPLWGVPFVIKDNIDLGGAPTTAACPAFAYDAAQDAFAVSLLRSAGALLIGKTNLDQFATGLAGVRTPYGAPKNALDPQIPPGGSSSGSAVAVAHGIASFSLGTDTAGSGRVPAGLNNIVGLKTNAGRDLKLRRCAGLPDARHNLDLCAYGWRCLAGFPGRGGSTTAPTLMRARSQRRR